MIYLDYQATTPLAPEVVAAMRPWNEERFANPHSPSRWGRGATGLALDRFVRDLLTAQGSTWKNGAAVFYRNRREPDELAALLFGW